MRKFVSLLVAVGLLFGAYAITFGLPGTDATSEAAQPQSAAGGRPAGGPPGGGRARGATSVVTTALEQRPYEVTLYATGTASSLRSADVVTETAGTVVETRLTANRDVEQGEVLVRLDARTQELNLEIARANLQQATDTVDRYDRLRAGGNSTITDVAQSEARVAQQLADAEVGLAEVALEDRTIRAPISGRLGLSEVEVGDILGANDVIATIDQTETLVVEFELPERAIGVLGQAHEVLVSTSAFVGRSITGDILSFDSRIDAVTRSVTVKAKIDNAERILWPGMTFAVRLLHESEPLPVLPSTAVTWSRMGAAVWVDDGGTATRVPITILYRKNEFVWVEADIADGAMVVTEGAQKLRDGAKITAVGAETEKAPS
ncbi:efflux RND transporter periplasmic adaptor subunit [Sulfitobacter pontiacus]|uniref:efflux RND transporter periplasmic adaptor subunit n=1 Tax=Sulfitobacter pontiacus TaxID=60137 RepID=UPI000C3A520F|nr:efflux RND transporter periplasmic adaptor subunit [Sulfitobacter pontiacus]MAN09544.1 efflux transporter periplasmic adaptor subunit [Roseobacter sp.]HCI98765.1 efflux RND transporter periplasmic adaptor subunit [Sulfitobacter sp.]HJO49117.1 efflux RND transporter periplasmic adaptor subunit [Sulfitobacter pontiacus]|tara:strand:- start:3092 stop:4222 length:1131 start_codon:yes stop_codon:yes gene_type:complete